ncbi:MAG: GNAT family protein [bacterium]|nr:GNAT family protein [bacterium]
MINKDILKKKKIDGEHLYLRPVQVADVTEDYVGWLNNKEINQYLESRFVTHTLESVEAYVEKNIGDPDIFFFAIIRKDNNCHIGNIKLGPVDWHHKIGDIGIIIGDKDSWGKGYATEAIAILSSFAFSELGLHKLTASAYENNVGSIKAFQNAGFSEEGRKKNHYLYQDKYIDSVLLAKIN